ncbi:hypothetical protein E2320_001442 [Naja naja]|nr:hypothetical protein E2320_001442 [Naja naja]
MARGAGWKVCIRGSASIRSGGSVGGGRTRCGQAVLQLLQGLGIGFFMEEFETFFSSGIHPSHTIHSVEDMRSYKIHSLVVSYQVLQSLGSLWRTLRLLLQRGPSIHPMRCVLCRTLDALFDGLL